MAHHKVKHAAHLVGSDSQHWIANSWLWDHLGHKRVLVYLVMFLIIMQLVNFITGKLIGILLGNRPRKISGILGIFSSWTVHSDWGHLIANLPSFTLMGWLILDYGNHLFWRFLVFVVIVEGLFTWLIGRSNTYHIGASGICFAMFSFLVTRGFISGAHTHIIASLITLVLFKGLVRALIKPASEDISWEGHLGGFLAGILAAFYV